MASKKKNAIGCRAGRARIVDPNDFDGFDADSNVPVQLEDLNISVALTSFRKGRTLLTGESTDSSKDNVAQISVNFIEGTNLGGKKVLTTSYTDLTTRFDSDVVNDEALGITNIDIEFNASMAPLITINFIDVRGSAVFQNEENILNNRGNKYTTFFQLPYPMYELEVKGYYGLPVKYCLHMLKFNTKFNSQTGNFEITANFIGYTFALMADMLIGYLKAIPFTAIGKTRMDKYNETISSGIPVLTLSDLSVNISRLNEGIEKVANENPASKEINAATDAIDILDNIKSEIYTLGTVFEPESSKDDFKYIVYKYASDYTEAQKNAFTNQYIITVKKLIKDYNDLLPPTPLVEAHFTLIESNTNKDGGKKYTEITYGNLKTDDQATNDALGNPSNVQEIKEKLVSYINSKNSDLNNDTNVLNIFDMTLLYETLATAKLSVEVSEKESKKKLAKAFENEVRDILGFDPTARTIIECFTAAIEVFIETIYQVSSEASASTIRADELATKFTVDDSKVTDMKDVYIEKKQFFPWPDYREKDDVKKSYVDKYLGAAGVLKKPDDVDELRFIDDLLEAFRKSKKADDAALEEQLINDTTWTSVNPIDTIIYQELEPYKRLAGPKNTELLLKEDIVRLMVIRGMIFLGYSNDLISGVVTDDEIRAMAEAEVDNMLRGILDETSRQSMSLLTIEYLNGITGEQNGVSRKVVNQDSDPYYYDYFLSDAVEEKDSRFLPTNLGFHKEIWPKLTNSDFKALRDDNGYLFLSNYGDWGVPTEKEDDGGINVSILTELPKPISIGFTPEGVKTETTMILANLIGDPDDLNSDLTLKDAGYNCFNHKYGIQEFETMDWGDDNIKGLPLMYVFYRDCDTGLAYTRKATGTAYNSEFSTVSEYFYKDKTIVTYPLTKPEVFFSNGFTLGRPIHTNLGKNRDLFNKIVKRGRRADVTYPYIELKYGTPDIELTDWTIENNRQPYTDYSFSLFGSEFYYNQSYATIITSNGTKVSCAENSRAFLFLQAMPFNTPQITRTPGGNPFGKNEIRHLFDMKAGIIHAPKLWCAYIGSILWRMDESDPILNNNNQIIGGGVGKKEYSNGLIEGYVKGDPIVWYIDYSNGNVNKWNSLSNWALGETLFDIPDRNEYFPPFLDYTQGGGQGVFKAFDGPSHPDIGDFDTLKTIPDQVRIEFKKMFFNFVNGEGDKDWRGLAKRLEIFDTNGDLTAGKYFSQYLHSILDKANDKNANIASVEEITTGRIIGNPIQFSVLTENIEKYYDIVIPIYQDKGFFYSNINDFYLHLQLKDGTGVINSLIDALTEEVFIVNNNYKIWSGVGFHSSSGDVTRADVVVSPDKYNLYFDAIIKKLETLADNYNISKQNERIDKEIFNTTNKDIIRLQLYRHCKNVYDKWLGGAKDIDHLVFQCGNGTRSTVDDTLAKKNQNSKTRMIDSFRFVTRSFRDIGNELYINPSNLNEYLIDNPNSSSYDAISSILGANHFNFQALPNFVNFHDDTILESIFKPYNYNDKNIPLNSCGPAFVCVYDGQTSKHLELTERDGDYPNDGFDLRCMKDKDGENTDLDVSVPTDFTTDLNSIDEVDETGVATSGFYEEPVSTFLVRYSQQNQSIFKDIHLDQSEFSETDESLHIQDEISQKGSENNRALVGQNIYNVYAVRSYTAQIEMMGNAMIQPMMYFQLDNIPMFHGAYMITKVSHSIKPNSMSTNFTGTRIRYTETPLIEAYEVYVDLINTMDISEAGSGTIGGGGGDVSGTFEPIVATLIENGVSNAYIDKGKTYGSVTTKDVDLKDTGFSRTSSQIYMISEASDALTKMLKEWSKWMGDNGYQKNASGKYGNIGSLYRTYASQTVLAGGQKTAAAAGTSYHGWGLAVDMSWVNKNGDMMQFNYTNGSIRKDFDYTYNPAIEWLYNNSYRFGFINPLWARNGGSYDEAWHWEYHGTSAKCLLNKSPNVFGKPIDMTKEYDSVVKNPKKSDGSESVYTGCEAKYIKRAGDGSDSSTIVQKTGCPSLPTNGTNKVLSKDMYLELKNITKLSNESISGIMGNLYRESNFNPQSFTSLSGGCGAYGFAQWRGDRLKSLDSLAKSSNSTIDDYKVQLNFMYSELSDYWSYTLAAMKNAKSVEDATKIFATTYEAGTKGHFNFNVDNVLNGEYDPKRIKFAKQYYNMIKTNTFDELKE